MTIEEVRNMVSHFIDFMQAKTIIEKMRCYCVYDKRYGDMSCYHYQEHKICYDVILHCINVFEPIITEDGYTHLVTQYYLRDYGKTWAMSKEELK